jgi:hypothetical protein
MALFLLLSAAALGAPTAQAQTPAQDQGTGRNPNPTSDEPAENGPVATAGGESRAPVPVPLNIDAGSLQFSQESTRGNFLRAGVQLGATYDDNLLATSAANQVGGASYSVLPQLSLNQTRPRLRLTLDYNGGYVVNQRFHAYNQSSQQIAGGVRYRVTPHVNLLLNDRFLYTSNFFDQLQGTGTPGAGAIQLPNQTIINPLARRTDNLGTAAMSYQYSAGDMVGANGTSYYSRYRDIPVGSTALQDTRNEEADGFYTHRFALRNWSGVAYKFQRLTFNPGTEQATVHSYLGFHTVYLEHGMTLGVFGGAEYSDLKSQIVVTTVALPVVSTVSVPTGRQNWSWTAGATYGWQGERTSVTLSGRRKVSDGGGILSTAELITGIAGLRRQLTRSGAVRLGGLYGDSRALEKTATSFGQVKSASGTVAWEQRLGRSFTATLGYARDYQKQFGSVAPSLSLTANHNRGWVMLGYVFEKPLGR